MATLKDLEPESMSVDELWEIHEKIGQVLYTKIQTEQEKLQAHLSRLRGGPRNPRPRTMLPGSPDRAELPRPPRRPYPEVKPKYNSLKDPTQTWSGRGKQPRWLVAEMKGGKVLEDFLIGAKPAAVRKKAR